MNAFFNPSMATTPFTAPGGILPNTGLQPVANEPHRNSTAACASHRNLARRAGRRLQSPHSRVPTASATFFICTTLSMPAPILLHDLVRLSAERAGDNIALTDAGTSTTYGGLQSAIEHFASGMLALGLRRADRVAVYLDKRVETVVASFAATAAGGVFVPLNPLLKSQQVAYILRDCAV